MERSGESQRLSMQPLGVSAQEEHIYRALLGRPDVTTEALAPIVGMAADVLAPVLALLEKRGLVRNPSLKGWVAAAPEVAVNLLLMERQVELTEARRVLPELQAELARQSAAGSPVDVQVLPGDPQEQLRAFLQLLDGAQTHVAIMIRPPFIGAAPETIDAAKDAARKRGVRIKSILSPEVMAWDGWQAAVRQCAEVGDEMRILDDLPFKLIMADGRRAMVPLYPDAQDGAALLIGDTVMARVLNTLFEQMWEDAVPAVNAPPGSDDDGHPDGEHAMRELVAVLAAGTNDKTAAHVLGVSERTLQRRIASLMDRLRAKSRFQAGVLAARRFDV